MGGVGRSWETFSIGVTLATAADIAGDRDMAGPSTDCTLGSEVAAAAGGLGSPALGEVSSESVFPVWIFADILC